MPKNAGSSGYNRDKRDRQQKKLTLLCSLTVENSTELDVMTACIECFCTFLSFDNQFPSGRTIESDVYAGDSYQLIVPSPVEDGEYQCEVPKRYNDLTCTYYNDHGKITVNMVR